MESPMLSGSQGSPTLRCCDQRYHLLCGVKKSAQVHSQRVVEQQFALESLRGIGVPEEDVLNPWLVI